VRKADNLPSSCAVVTKSGNLNFLEPSGPLQACNGADLPYLPLLKGIISINIIKIVKSTVPYPNTCGACMFPSFQLDRIIHCPVLCIHFQINFLTSNYKISVFFYIYVYTFYIHGSVHRESNLIIVQQDATYSAYYISVGSSTCFGW